jgi:hypothetical protein
MFPAARTAKYDSQNIYCHAHRLNTWSALSEEQSTLHRLEQLRLDKSFAMALDTLPKGLVLMILSNLHNRHDREIWRRVCRLTNTIYLEDCLSRINVYAKKHDIDIMPDKPALCTLDQFQQWTQVGYRSNEVAVEAARSLFRGHLDNSTRSQEIGSLENDSEEKDLGEPEVMFSGQAIVNTLHVYIGDQNFESHLRNLLLSVRRLDRQDMTWADALFRSRTYTNPIDDTSAFSTAHLLISQHISRHSLADGVVREFQRTLGSDRFRAFFCYLLMGDDEKISAATELFEVLKEKEIWLTQDALEISKRRGYPLTGHTFQYWASNHLLALKISGNKGGEFEFCERMLNIVRQQRSGNAKVTSQWYDRFLRAHHASAGVTEEAAAAAKLSLTMGKLVERRNSRVRTRRRLV